LRHINIAPVLPPRERKPPCLPEFETGARLVTVAPALCSEGRTASAVPGFSPPCSSEPVGRRDRIIRVVEGMIRA